MINTTNPYLRLCYLFPVILLLFFPALSSGAEQQAAAPEPAAEQKSGLIEIYIRSNALPKELIDLQNAIGGLSDVNLIEKQIPELSKQVEEMEWQATSNRIPISLFAR